jgi:hypothetical protein
VNYEPSRIDDLEATTDLVGTRPPGVRVGAAGIGSPAASASAQAYS